MKTRNSFVSNSSSCSFIILFDSIEGITKEHISFMLNTSDQDLINSIYYTAINPHHQYEATDIICKYIYEGWWFDEFDSDLDNVPTIKAMDLEIDKVRCSDDFYKHSVDFKKLNASLALEKARYRLNRITNYMKNHSGRIFIQTLTYNIHGMGSTTHEKDIVETIRNSKWKTNGLLTVHE